MKIGGLRDVILRRNPECREEREECSFEFGSGVVGFDVKHRTLWLGGYCVRSKGKQGRSQDYRIKQAQKRRNLVQYPFHWKKQQSPCLLLTKIDKTGKKSGVLISWILKYFFALSVSNVPYAALAGSVHGGLFPLITLIPPKNTG